MVYKMEDTSNKLLTNDQLNIINAFEKLWLNISSWLGIYIKALIYDTRNLKSVTNILYDLPSKFYNTFSIFYGTEPAQKLMNLLFEFLQSSMQVTESIKYGDYVKTSSSIIDWYKVADKIAEFLAKINVFWDETQWRYLLYQYIKLQIDDINALVNDNFEKDIELNNKIIDTVYLISDYMARGIISSNMQQTNASNYL